MATNILGINFPDLLLGIPVYQFLILMVVFVVVLLSLIFFAFIYYFRIYKNKVIVFENIAGRGYQPTFRDKARIIKIGDGGEELLWLKKKKVYRTAYGKKMGKNTYWFAVGQDGYWYNITLGDVDTKMGMLDIEPTNRQMRFMNVANRKNIEERYKKGGIMEKYGTIIISFIFFVIVAILVAWIFSKFVTTADKLNQTAVIYKEVAQSNERLMTIIDKLCGTGFVPTDIPTGS